MNRCSRLLVALLALVVVAGCGSGSDRATTTALPEGGSGFRIGGGEGGPAGEAPARPPRTVRLPMPLERAATQLLLVGFEGTEPRASFFARLRDRGYGAVAVGAANSVDDAQLTGLTGEIDVVAEGNGHPPPVVVATTDLRPRASSRQLAGLGIDALLGPPLDLGRAGGPWEGRALGDDPAGVAGAATISVRRALAGGVAPIVGHFPGEGGASQDPSVGTATVGLSLPELELKDLQPFRAVLPRVPAIQMSGALYAAWDGVTPATHNEDVVGYLRDRLKYRGAVVSADLGAVTLTTGQDVGQAAVAALRAGCDLLWVPGNAADQAQAAQAIVRAVRQGRVPVARVADALRQVGALQRRFAAPSR